MLHALRRLVVPNNLVDHAANGAEILQDPGYSTRGDHFKSDVEVIQVLGVGGKPLSFWPV